MIINVNDSQYFAVSLCGNDKGRIYVVLYEENGFVFLADGKHRRISSPKKKKKRHIKAFSANKLIGYVLDKYDKNEDTLKCEFKIVSKKAISDISEETISVSREINSETVITDGLLRRAIRDFRNFMNL